MPQGASYILHADRDGIFPVINFTINDNVRIDEIFSIPLRNQEPYFRLFEKLQEVPYTPRNRFRRLELMYGILRLLTEESLIETPMLKQALWYIENNYRDNTLTNQILAEQVHVSEVYLRQLFQRELNTTPKQYILLLRMKLACQMLDESDATVTEIAAYCGFSSIYHFGRAFQRAMGMTPTEYRISSRYTFL